jgi:hypothetical protein
MCVETCTTDANCGSGHICNQFGRCQQDDTFAEVCNVDADCIPEASGWNSDCDQDSDCPGAAFGQVCVNIGGGIGKCATGATAPSCFLQPNTFDMPKIDGSGNVSVCGDNTSQKCHPQLKFCAIACTTSGDCTLVPGSPACVSGLCGCNANSQCTSGFCNTTTGACGCDSSGDCSSTNNSECINGTCGCNGTNDCTQAFPGTTLACQ